jgi:hypothetical protein
MSLDAYIQNKLSFEICPLILTGGIATASGGALPITSLTQRGLPNPRSATLDDYFCHFEVSPGSSILRQEISHLPSANQAIAANGTIAQPLNVSLIMICPINQSITYGQKATIMQSLQASLAQHNNLGGTYTVMTQFFPYTNCIMLDMRDVSTAESKQTQFIYQLDFEQPLVSLDAVTAAYNGLTSKIANGTSTGPTPTWSGGAGLPVGNPSNLANQSLVAQPSLSPGLGLATALSALGI